MHSQYDRKNRNLREKNIQPLTKQLKLVWCAKESTLCPIWIRADTALSLRFFCVSWIHGASGLFPWRIELLNCWKSKFAPKAMDFSVRSIRILFIHSALCATVAEGTQPLEFIGKNTGETNATKKSPGDRIGTTVVTPARPVLPLKVSVVATISLCSDCFSILIWASKICFRFSSIFYYLELVRERLSRLVLTAFFTLIRVSKIR